VDLAHACRGDEPADVLRGDSPAGHDDDAVPRESDEFRDPIQVVGATNSLGAYPAECPLSSQDLLATKYRHLGIDTRAEFHDFAGRPFPILSGGEPIRELI